MRFRFKTEKLKELYTLEKNEAKYPSAVVDRFFDVMSVITYANDERDLYSLRSLHFEKLKGEREGQRSLRLNKQWRLIVILEVNEEGKVLLILDIENHYR
ncbi:MAG: type II toxin-antitoxin system RelE/ParE family toxin [Chloroflexota bacterium]|nr:type II toxin-antitoxin system RelE/ParE family toxin [Chloroflexota bacterium]